MSLQELHIFDVCPHTVGRDSRGLSGVDAPEKVEYDAACRRQVGKAIREVVSQLPRLRCLRMTGVKVEDPGQEYAMSHPWTQLE